MSTGEPHPDYNYDEIGIEDYESNWVIQEVVTGKDFICYERWTVTEPKGWPQRNNLTGYEWVDEPTMKQEAKSRKWFKDQTNKFPNHLHIWIRGRERG